MRFHALRYFSLLLIMGLGFSGRLWAGTLPPSQTDLRLSSQSVSTGTAVTLTASVTSQGHPIHPGLVQFCNADAKYCEDISILGQAQLTASGTATIKLTLPLGTHHIKAVFQGTNIVAGSTSEMESVAVSGKYPTNTAIIGEIEPPWTAPVYSLTGVVWSSGTQNITGSLKFLDQTNNNEVLAGAQLGGSGRGVADIGLLGSSTNGENYSNIEAGITADFNGDGKLDHALPGFKGSSGFSVLLGNGDGTFQQLASQAVGDAGITPFAITVGDFNNDDIPDIAAADPGSSKIYILLGKGDGTFTNTQPINTLTPSNRINFITGDFNGDGNVDLAIASDTNLKILLGNGDGTFTPLPEQSIPYSNQIVVGDFNQDGKADLLSTTSGNPWVVLGNGDGTFTAAPSMSFSFKNADSVAVGDFNHDGKPDFVVIENGSVDCETCVVPGNIYVFLGNGDGTFVLKSTTTLVVDMGHVDVGDFNGDGIADIITVADDIFGITGTVYPLYGAGDGTFSLGSTFAFPTGYPLSGRVFSLGDFNGDGRTDLIIPGYLDTALFDVTSTSATVNNISPTGRVGYHNVFAQYSGDADNPPGSSGTTPLLLQAATSINLQISPQTVARGEPVQLTATLSPFSTGGYTATGTITFHIYTQDRADPQVVVSQATTTFTTVLLPIGTTGITASYSGDTFFTGSSSNVVTLTVSGNRSTPTETFLEIDPSSSVKIGNVITLSAKVTSQGKPLSQGQVIFCDADSARCEDTALLGEAQLAPKGTATIRLRPSVGLNHIRAIFQNTGQYVSSRSNIKAVTVSGLYPTTTKIYWWNDTLLSAVASYGKYTPAGTVSFLDQTTGSSLGSTQLPGFATWFTPEKQASLNQGSNQQALVTADFNHDGIPDIASANADGTVTIALGKGNGSFLAKPNFSVATALLQTISTADFNQDGIPDLAVSFTDNASYARVIILQGKGDGTFLPLPSQDLMPWAGETPLAVEVPDLNSDGIPDLVIEAFDEFSYGNVLIYLGNGDGTFSKLWHATIISTPPETAHMAIGDFNGDGVPDFVATDDSTIKINWGQGDGTFKFGPWSQLPTVPSSIITGDFNGDGILDLVTTSGTYDSKGNLLNGTVTLSLGKGDGTFSTISPINTGSKSIPQSVTVQDFNGDGKLDIAVAAPPPTGDSSKGAGILTFLFGRGDGTFSKPDPFYNWGYNGIAAADFNGDGVPDLAITNSGSKSVGVLLSAKTTFGYISHVKLPGSGPQSVNASYSGDQDHAPSVSGSITIPPPTR